MQLIKTENICGNVINVYGTNDQPLFLAKDVAEWIEHSQPRKMVESICEEEKMKEVFKIPSSRSSQEQWFLTEDGLYEVFFQSRKPRAKQFKKWIKNILKDIRKTGMYATDELLDNPDLMIKAMEKLKEERAKNKALESKIKEDQPRVHYAKNIENNDGTILVRDFSKVLANEGIKLGQNKLYEKLRDFGYICKKSTLPTQRGSEQELFVVRPIPISTPKGDIINLTTRITGKGQIFLLDKIKKELI